MSGITASTGIFSGIDSASLIEQLLQAESRPKIQFQSRIIQLQSVQAAYLDINSRLSALQSAAAKFRTSNSFDQKKSASSDEDSLTATAASTAAPGTYRFLVDRLVTTQQMLSRGFADKNTSAFGASSFTFESARARLDRDVSLSELNGGTGIQRGKFTITQDANTVTIDLSRAATVNDVLDAINGAGLDLTASAADGSFTITSTGSAFTIAEKPGGSTAASLGLTGVNGTTTTDGARVLNLTANVALDDLNDGTGVYIDNSDSGNGAFDFRVTLDSGGTPQVINVHLGDVYGPKLDEDDQPVLDEKGNPVQEIKQRAVTTLGGVIDRANEAIADAGVTGLELRIAADGVSLEWANSTGLDLTVTEKDASTTTARDLGILANADLSATVAGTRIYGALDSKLLRNLNGGSGVTLGVVAITDRDGVTHNADLTGADTVRQVIDTINAATGGAVTASLNSAGNGLLLTDSTGGTNDLVVSGAAADSLGIATAGVASSTVKGTDLEFRYVSEATRLEDFDGGRGVGTGVFTVRDGTGVTHRIDIGSDTATIGDLLAEINGQFSANSATGRIQARINDSGDGILIEEIGAADGAVKLRVVDETGSVAKNLRIAGTASDTGDENFIDGSLETTVEFGAADTLQTVVDKINDADPKVGATIINDGTGVNPFRLSFSSDRSGKDGRFVLDTNGFDLGLSTLDSGDDALLFYGSSDPAKGVLVSSSTNSVSTLVPGLTIDLKGAGSEPVDVNVTTDEETLLEDINGYIEAFNTLIGRIDQQTAYDSETEQRGVLLGDSTTINLRSRLFSIVQGRPVGVGGRYTNLAQIGITIGSDSKLELDSERFKNALQEDRQAVEDLLAARDLESQDTTEQVTDANGNVIEGATVRVVSNGDTFSRQGIASLLEELGKTYTNSVDGILTGRRNILDTQIKQQQDRIEAFDARLENRRAVLSQQFLAMEQAIASIQLQQSSLSSISALG